jgi:hypothetical protein
MWWTAVFIHRLASSRFKVAERMQLEDKGVVCKLSISLLNSVWDFPNLSLPLSLLSK